MNIKYPLAKETINDEDVNALCDWLKSYPRLTKGQLTLQVEDDWAQYIGTKYAVFNNSGSSANLLMVATAIECGLNSITSTSSCIEFSMKIKFFNRRFNS